MNLAVNARDAMPRRRHAHDRDGERRCSTTTYAGDCIAASRPARYVVLAVSDTGAAWTRRRASASSSRSSRRRRSGKGTGLGLATVYGIVKQIRRQHLGLQRAGTRDDFKVYLPGASSGRVQLARARRRSASRGRRRSPARRGRGPRCATRRAWCSDHSATRCSPRLMSPPPSGWCAPASSGVDVVLTDAVMPGKSGLELAQILQIERPDLARHPHVRLCGGGDQLRSIQDAGNGVHRKAVHGADTHSRGAGRARQDLIPGAGDAARRSIRGIVRAFLTRSALALQRAGRHH